MKLLIFLLAAIVVISGCTVPGTDIEIPGIPDFFGSGVTGKGDIIVFKEVIAVPPAVKKGGKMKIFASLENQGTEEKDVVTDIFNFCPGLFTFNGMFIDGKKTEAVKFSGEKSNIKILPGEVKQVEWRLTAKDVPVETRCDIQVAAGYKHTAEGTTTITFINQGEYEKQLQSGTLQPTSSQVVTGDGPVTAIATVKTAQPIPANTNPEIEITIKDQGKGYVYLYTPDKKEPFHFSAHNVSLVAPGLQSVGECAFTGDLDHAKLNKNIRLLKGKSTPITCVVKLNQKDFAGDITNLIKLSATYFYVTEGKVKVTVKP